MTGRPETALLEHLATPEEARNAKWRHRFYDLVDVAMLTERDPRIFVGPDGFPYYALDVPDEDEPRGTIDIDALLENATTRGFGIAIEPDADEAAWVFTCGDLVTKRAFGSWEFPRIGVAPESGPTFRDVLKDSAAISIGAPSATLLPPYLQPLLHRYFTQTLGIAEPGVFAMHSPHQDPPEQLVFRISRADFSSDETFEAALAGITWFLPRHIVVSVLPPDILAGFEDNFIPLRA